MAQKTLIIGIGSTGMAVGEDVLQRIVDEYGSLDRVPWVKAVAFETARVTSSIGLMRDRTHSIGIPTEEYSALIMNPGNFDDMAFNEWQDPQVVSLANGSTDGAGNVRMIGRISWMYRTNLLKFENEVKRLLDELSSLTEQAANEALGRTPYSENPDIRFDKDASGQSKVTVFVCGTLTGGTCSGCFVDVGYFLRTWPGVSSQIANVIGLLGIPNVSYPIDIQTANAYAALTELNHFYHRGAVYDVKFPTRPERTKRQGLAPFDSIFLGHPPNGIAGAEKALTRSYGQFIYLASLSQMGDQVRAKLINPTTVYAGTPDRQGNPMTFASLGVSAIEYPSEHIMKACSYRLAASAISDWKGTPGVERGPADLIITRPGLAGGGVTPELSRDQIRSELRKAPEGKPSFSEIIQAQVERGVAAGLAGAMVEVMDSETVLESGFDHKVKPDSPIARVFIDGVIANGDKLVDDRIARVKAMFRDRITDADSGPAWCRDMADHLHAYCTEWLGQMRSSAGENPLADLRGMLEHTRQRMEEAQNAFSLKLGWKPTAAKICSEEYRDASMEYWEARIGLACEPYEANLCNQIIELCVRLKKRLTHEFYGISRWGDSLALELQSRHDVLNEREPDINGELLYDAMTTIGRDYERILSDVKHDGSKDIGPGYQGEAFARRKVVRGWTWIADQLLAPRDESFFDDPITAAEQNQPKPVRNNDAMALASLSRGYFEPLLQINALDRLYAQPDPDTVIDEVWRKSSGFLDVSDNRNPIVRGTGGKGALHHPTFAFFRGARSAGEGSNGYKLRQRIEPKVAFFEELLEPHRVVFMQARSTFSLSMIAGFNPDIDSTFRAHYRDRMRSDGRTYHSRSGKNIRWRPLDGPFSYPERSLNVARILAGIALGRIRGAGDSPLIFDFKPLHPGEEGGPIELSHDLDDAAFRLYERPSAAMALKNALEEEMRSKSMDDIALSFDDFKNNVAKFNLSLAGNPVAPKDAYQLLLVLVKAVPGLLPAWKARFSQLPTVDQYLRRDGESRLNGYYCPSPECGAFLADETQPDQVPAVCPSCGCVLLLKD
ncbi:MAG: hypothetical protein K1X67_16520 [Fimbriimonadaceae bacterium]|nr:hypothetical protein [Fimbriimonadaceae bacterium]